MVGASLQVFGRCLIDHSTVAPTGHQAHRGATRTRPREPRRSRPYGLPAAGMTHLRTAPTASGTVFLAIHRLSTVIHSDVNVSCHRDSCRSQSLAWANASAASHKNGWAGDTRNGGSPRSSVVVKVGDRDVPVVPLADLELAFPDIRRVMDRWRPIGDAG